METVAESITKFRVGEITGALGDSITVLPLIVALGLLTPASLPHVLIGFAVFQIVWGLYYGTPLSVEPMKALVGLAIAGALTYGEVVAAGLLAGVILLGAGRMGVLSKLAAVIGEPVIRGVQFSVALLLVVAGLEVAIGEPIVAGVGIVLALLIAFVSPQAVALGVLAFGTIWAITLAGIPTPSIPVLTLFPAGGPAFTVGALEGLIAQLAMTIGNAAVATSLLLSDLYNTDSSPDALAESMGIMNISAVPFGAVPMCHGSGGLAGKFAFGAQTGMANLYAGVLYAALALFAGILFAFPMAILGVLLLVVAWSLGKVALENTDHRLIILGMGGLAIISNIGLAFVVGAIWWYVSQRMKLF